MKQLIAILIWALCAGCTPRQPSGPSVEKWLDEKFPVGTSLDEVKKVLSKEKIEFSWVEKERTIYGIFRNTDPSKKIVSESVSFKIFMDENDRVKKIEVQKVFTGP